MKDAKMSIIGTFPFGQTVHEVVQTERTPKQVFVLGVYASAVHARWLNKDGDEIVKALAVASEPYIFWRGEGAESIINKIPIPNELGRLEPAEKIFNGPSGLALDELVLNPLNLDRNNTWLCDLVPHSCVNSKQSIAIEREYVPIAEKYRLPVHSVPILPKLLTDEKRRTAIMNEILESKSKFLILLGDQPVKWFLSFYDNHWNKLSDFGKNDETYGKLHETIIEGRKINVLPLTHPRQSARLGESSAIWYGLHDIWRKKSAGEVAQIIK
jgi:uracil-DNA glycosylase